MALFTGHTITSDSALGSAVIQRSLRFNRSDEAYLQTTLGNSNLNKWTLSIWVKKAVNGEHQAILASGDSSVYTMVNFGNSDRLKFTNYPGSSAGIYITTRKFRDPSAWYHIVAIWDSGNSTAGDRIRLYVNGVRETAFDQSDNPNQDQNSVINGNTQGGSDWGNGKHRIGRFSNYTDYTGCYYAEANFVDGQAYDPSYFGFTDSQTGIWMPKRYEGVYGSNGFYLDFSDNSSTTTLGIDKSPNGNDFTLNNFSVSAGAGNDSLEDTPTNVFATLNPLVGRGGNYLTHTNGNLDFDIQAQSTYPKPVSTFNIPTSGKWYAEWVFTTIGSAVVGVGNVDKAEESGAANQLNGINYLYNGDIRLNDSHSQGSFTSWSANDVIGVKVDRDAGTIAFTLNGSAQGNPENISSMNTSTDFVFWAYRNASGGSAPVGSVNFGQRPFSHLPSGYKALCSNNLPPNNPSIVRPQKHFQPLLYTGQDTSSLYNVTGLEFAPDFVWAKARNDNIGHIFIDTVRGDDKQLEGNLSDAEVTRGTPSYRFLKDGFAVSTGGNMNNPVNYVAFCWKAGGAAVSNTDGSITSSVSVNQEAGFSIVTHTGTGADATVGHGLGKIPACIIIKNRDRSVEWIVKHQKLTSGKILYLNLSSGEDAATGTNNGIIGDLNNASTFSLSRTSNTGNYNNVNVSGEKYVSYCWTEIPGYSKFGFYTGNGNSDGTYVDMGFRPAFLILKKINTANSWVMFDVKRSTTNVIDNYLIAEGTDVDNTNSAASVDFLSNGVKFRSGYDIVNAGDYIYMAFAEQPGVTPFDTVSNAR